MTGVIRGRLFDGNALLGPGSLHIADGRITALGTGPGAGQATVDLGDALITPGLVDVHCHGGGGAEFSTDPAAVTALHRAHGTTTMVASLVTDRIDDLVGQIGRLAELVEAGELAGIHLEGPWLAPGKRGAHPRELLRPPEPADVRRLLAAGRGTVRLVTLAPELPGGLAAIRLLAERGVVAAVGHTEAGLTDTLVAIEAGATGATHLFNAMPPMLHRAPGPVLALCGDQRVWLELIADGVHVHPALVAQTMRHHGARVVLITDAMAAAGLPDGDYRLGRSAVEVRDRIARLAGGDTIAGSTLTMDRAVRTAIDAGVAPDLVLRSATALPARYLGLPAGRLAVGRAADLVVWTPDWRVRGVARNGEWLVAP